MSELEYEVVAEIPKRGGGGGKQGGGKYAQFVQSLVPGEIRMIGPFGVGAAGGAVARLKKLGAEATSRNVEGEVFVFVQAGDGATVAPAASVVDDEWELEANE